MTHPSTTGSLARDCICGRRLLQDINEGTCLLCGHGPCHPATRVTFGKLARLPRDLGQFLREGRRLDPGHFENVSYRNRRRRRRHT